MKKHSLQDRFLFLLKQEEIPVTIFLSSGHHLRGLVQDFDNYTVFIQTGDVEQLIYKHAISSMVPGKHIDFMEEDDV
ncbi:MAG TPA: RNA chaperone Hfq [Clostridia bacterium]|nr:RNA chaperone Hfq [Clostridia bacterium]